MNKQTLQPFSVIGISIRTTNENNQAAQDIPVLWAKFMSEGILQKIPNKIDSSIYSIYTEYEKDHTRPYTTILGCRVSSLETIPEGMVGKQFEGGTYDVRTAKGNIMEGLVYNEWLKIWAADLPRTFTADFEVYGEKAQNPMDAEVDIFVAIR
ncbi:MAG: AraC family transcriptional regulator [Bacteroidetes bacterium]|jgi:predicted transcriptional regulator YdeE|nr:AraC family transcriptional regulator [Bacteroidota bacterium]